MSARRVVAGREYIFYATLLDLEHRDLNGLTGQVVNLPGAPKANTMGHAYFEVPGQRVRLVATNSLRPLSDAALVAGAIRADMARIERKSDAAAMDWQINNPQLFLEHAVRHVEETEARETFAAAIAAIPGSDIPNEYFTEEDR